MHELRIVGVESGALLLSGDDGARYRVTVDEGTRNRLRSTSGDAPASRKLSPKEIQSQIRAGKTADEVAELSGASLDYIRRFEGPVLAEREHVVSSALRVPVSLAIEPEFGAESLTFGSVITERLTSAEAVGERWSSWRDADSSWVLSLTYTLGGAERDARWSFDPKRHTLVPTNSEALALSQQEEPTGAPRLRAVPPDAQDGPKRFDSGAFDVPAKAGITGETREEPVDAAHRDRGEPGRTGVSNQTADLLEALRRRRGERESAEYSVDAKSAHPSTGSIRLVDVPLENFDGLGDTQEYTEQREPSLAPSRPSGSKSGGKGRASMPSWDEIVFGARSDDD